MGPRCAALVLCACACSDGVFLCELVAVLETRSGSRLPVSVVPPRAPGGRGTLTLQGVDGKPTSTAAALRVRIALPSPPAPFGFR